MNRHKRQLGIALLLSCWLFVGCNDSNRSKLVGTWGLKTADTLMRRLPSPSGPSQDTQTADRPTADRPTADAQAADDREPAVAPKMQIQFKSNNELTTITFMGRITPTPKQGTWAEVAFDASGRPTKIRCTIRRQVTGHDIEWIDDTTIKMNPPNMAGLKMKLTFIRLPPDSH